MRLTTSNGYGALCVLQTGETKGETHAQTT